LIRESNAHTIRGAPGNATGKNALTWCDPQAEFIRNRGGSDAGDFRATIGEVPQGASSGQCADINGGRRMPLDSKVLPPIATHDMAPFGQAQ
jgi:hypothetical protein